LVKAEAVERGLFCRYADRFYKATSSPVDPNQATVGSYDRIGLPSPMPLNAERFAHLDRDGIVPVGITVEPNMVLIAVQRFTNNKPQDVSVTQRYGERGIVTKVVVAEGAKPGSVCVTVVVRSWLPFSVGDKISTMGQCVSTIGKCDAWSFSLTLFCCTERGRAVSCGDPRTCRSTPSAATSRT
jgi:DNA-directed RNA polymerase beta subunit